MYSIPILWKHLLGNYLKVFLFCACAFVAVLLTTRLEEIARFATLSSERGYILWFALYQIPYILPIAIPVASLISSMILIQRLSQHSELTALRASGISLSQVVIPILVAAAFLSLANFMIVSEVATTSHLQSRLLEQRLRSINPLFLLKNKSLLKFNEIYLKSAKEKSNDSISDLILAIPNKDRERMDVAIIKHLEGSSNRLVADQATWISYKKGDLVNHFDHLIVENIEKATLPLENLFPMFHQNHWKLQNDHLKLSLLLLRIQEQKKELELAGKKSSRSSKILQRSYAEILRRISLALAVISFTFLGIAYSLSLGRNRSKKSIIVVISLVAFYLICFFAAKIMSTNVLLAATLYLFPHLLIFFLSMRHLRLFSLGVEHAR